MIPHRRRRRRRRCLWRLLRVYSVGVVPAGQMGHIPSASRHDANSRVDDAYEHTGAIGADG